MVTDEERRKAAEWLRSEIGNGHHWPGALTIAEAIGVPDPTGSGWEGRLLGRLADLTEPSEPPYNLYTLYETVFHRFPRCWECIEDDEVDELVDALLDICNSPRHEHIQRFQPSEPKVRCVAEVKVDGERLEKLAHDAAVELTGIDRDALLALADRMEEMAGRGACLTPDGLEAAASSIREALGAADGS